MHKLAGLAAAFFLLFLLWVIVQADTGASCVFFHLARSVPYGDKVGHLALFGLLSVLCNAAFRHASFSMGGFSLYRGSVLVAAFALSEELSQVFFPRRTLDAGDLLADLAGLLVGAVVSRYLSTRFSSLLS